jgi:hypothetical protein
MTFEIVGHMDYNFLVDFVVKMHMDFEPVVVDNLLLVEVVDKKVVIDIVH